MTLCTRADADYLRYRVLAWVERKMRVMPQILRLFVYPDQAVPTRTARHKKWLSATLRRFAAFTRPPLVVGGDKSRQRSSASFAKSIFCDCFFFGDIFDCQMTPTAASDKK